MCLVRHMRGTASELGLTLGHCVTDFARQTKQILQAVKRL